MCHTVYYRDHSGILAAGVPGLVFWFLFVKDDTPSRTPHCPRYTEADAQDTMNSYRHEALGTGYTFGDVWEARVRAVMVPLEEGVVPGPWNNGGRVVLMGDSVMKVRYDNTPFCVVRVIPANVLIHIQVHNQPRPWGEHTSRRDLPLRQRVGTIAERASVTIHGADLETV